MDKEEEYDLKMSQIEDNSFYSFYRKLWYKNHQCCRIIMKSNLFEILCILVIFAYS